MRIALLAGVALLVAACSQDDAPSEQVAAAAEEIVETAQGAEATPEVPAGPYAPLEECGDLEGAAEFRQRIAEAVKARDADAFVSLAAEDIKLDFGGGSGADELRRRLSAEDSALWSALDRLLTLGCAANAQGGMTIPRYFEQDIPGDPFQTMIVTGADIPLINPEHGKPIDRISWDAVTLVDGLRAEAPFQLVRYESESADEPHEGYVATKALRSVVDYRLVATRRNGKWSIISFIAGD